MTPWLTNLAFVLIGSVTMSVGYSIGSNRKNVQTEECIAGFEKCVAGWTRALEIGEQCVDGCVADDTGLAGEDTQIMIDGREYFRWPHGSKAVEIIHPNARCCRGAGCSEVTP